MIYPTITEYIEAIRFSEDNFDKLTNLVPVLKDNGEPYYSSGNFAVVFKMKDKDSGKLHAVKCFLKDQEGREESYRKISNYLETIENRYLIKTKFLEKELFVDTKSTDQTEFPVVVMDWVEGVPLDVYIREKINDKMYLEYLCYTFSLMAQNLIEQEFAHGDLKPDNILVKEDGMLVLVDYDGMYVPEMFGERSRELGSPDFQHPDRKLIDFDKHLDDFSLASILLSLKLISIDPSLLEKFGDKDGLLFSQKDYREFPGSEINAEIFKHFENKEVLNIYHLFLQALGRKMCVWNKEMWKLEVPDYEYDVDFSILKSLAEFDDARILFAKDCQFDILSLFEYANNNSNAQYKLGVCYENGIAIPANFDKALEWYTKSACNGNSFAQYRLAEFYYNEGPCQNYELAVKWFAEASYQGYDVAQNMLGNCFYVGVGVPQDFKMAFKWYELSYMQDNLDALHNAGNCSDIVSKFECAERGDSYAQYELGECFELGKYGVPQDMGKALDWYVKSAEEGNGDAQCKLLELNSMTFPDELLNAIDDFDNFRNYTQTFMILQKYSNINIIAKLYLARCYKNGRGVSKDEAMSLSLAESICPLFEKLVEKVPNDKYWLYLGLCYDIIKKEECAFEFFMKSAEAENKIAQFGVGYCYAYGHYVSRNYSKAVKWYSKSANQGYSCAENNLGVCFEYGDGVPKDYNMAFKLFSRSVEQHNAIAQCALGNCFYEGIGVEKDLSKAKELYTISALQGYSGAQDRLDTKYFG